MSANFSRFNAFYWTQTVKNNGLQGGVQTPIKVASIKQNFQSPILTTPSDYIVAVERFQLHLNGIPFYQDVGESIIIRRVVDDGIDDTVPLQFTSWSESDTVARLNVILAARPAPTNTFSVSIDHEGIVTLHYPIATAVTHYADLTEAPLLNEFLGLNQADAVVGVADLVSAFPRWDTGDQLDHIRITTSLPVVSDTVGQDKANILTDFIVPKSLGVGRGYQNATDDFDTNAVSVNYSQRQKLTFNTSERRYINMSSDAPVYNFTITAEFVRSTGLTEVISLPIGCLFSIKLGFYRRT